MLLFFIAVWACIGLQSHIFGESDGLSQVQQADLDYSECKDGSTLHAQALAETGDFLQQKIGRSTMLVEVGEVYQEAAY